MLFQQRWGLASLVAAGRLRDTGAESGLVSFRACGPDEFLPADTTLEGTLDPARGALPVSLKLERVLADGQRATFEYRVYESALMEDPWYPLSAATVWTGPGAEDATPIAYTVIGWEHRPDLSAASLALEPDLHNATVIDGLAGEIIRYDADGVEISRRPEVLPPGRTPATTVRRAPPRLRLAGSAALIAGAVIAILSLRAVRAHR